MAEMYVGEGRLADLRLDEVVLHEPAEVALTPYANRAPSEVTKRWILTNYKNWALKQPANLIQLPYLPRNATPQQKKAFEFKDLYDLRLTPDTITQLEHILDYFTAVPNPARLERMSVENVFQAAEERVRQINARASKEFKGKVENKKNYQIMMEFPGGFTMVEMLNPAALSREGLLMNHCVGDAAQGYGNRLKAGVERFFSLRDPNNIPHATIEAGVGPPLVAHQIKGKSNGAPPRRYWPMIQAFMKKYEIQVSGDPHNIGLLHFNGRHMTQDEFKDILMDPNDEEGKEIFKKWNSGNLWELERKPDLLMGLFSSLYGSEEMGPEMVEAVFRITPLHAIQVVEQHGNRFDFVQTVAAFRGLGVLRGNARKAFNSLLQALSPSEQTCKDILHALEQTPEERRGNRPYNYKDTGDEFIGALFQSYPEIYADMILSDKAAIKRELESDGARSAGPFFASIRRKIKPSRVMVEKAFHYYPESAMKMIARMQVELDPKDQLNALVGTLGYEKPTVRDEDENNRAADSTTLVSRIIKDYGVGPGVIGALFDRISKKNIDEHRWEDRQKEFTQIILTAVDQVNPDLLTMESRIKSIKLLDKSRLYREFFTSNTTVPLDMQEYVFDKAVAGRVYTSNEWMHALTSLQVVDPSLFEKTLNLLKPDAVSKTNKESKSVEDKSKPPVKSQYSSRMEYQTKYIQVDVKKKPEEYAKEVMEAKHKAATRFMALFRALAGAPEFENGELGTYPSGWMNPELPKYQAAEEWFREQGKEKLFQIATTRAGREHTQNAISTVGPGYSHRAPTDMQISRFAAAIPQMRDIDIAKTIRSTDGRELFAVLINTAPERFPDVLRHMTEKHKTGYSYRKEPDFAYQKLDWKGMPLDKEKVWAALQATWASKDVPDEIKDDLTIKVFKRFKPKPDQLMSMVRAADNEGALEYVLKKSKKPSKELVQYTYDEFPASLQLIPLDYIPDEMLRAMFERSNSRLWHIMTARDLRDYGTNDTRSKYKSYSFRGNIQRESDAFKRYEKAAEAAGKSEEFQKWARGAELEDRTSELVWDDVVGKDPQHGYDIRETRFNKEMLEKHIDEFSDSTLVHLARETRDVKGSKWAVPKFYFKHFDNQRLARLIRVGLFLTGGWGDEKQKVPLSEFGNDRLNEIIKIALDMPASPHVRARYGGGDFDDSTANVVKTFETFLANNFKPSDELIKVALSGESKDFNGYGYEDIQKRLIRSAESDEMKDWITDQNPRWMEFIHEPTEHMIEVLFDKWGYWKTDSEQVEDGKDELGNAKYKRVKLTKINYWFWDTVKDWTENSDLWARKDMHLPKRTLDLLMAEAKRRGPEYVRMVDACEKYLAKLRKRAETESYVSIGQPTISQDVASRLPPNLFKDDSNG